MGTLLSAALSLAYVNRTDRSNALSKMRAVARRRPRMRLWLPSFSEVSVRTVERTSTRCSIQGADRPASAVQAVLLPGQSRTLPPVT